MSETLRKYGAKFNRTFCTFTGLSTDTKPTGVYEGVNIANGSEFIEMDTDKKYLYDADSQTWKLAASGGGGGGGSATLIEKTITANGEYNASSDNADGYSSVTVNVANSYSQADNGKVVSNQELVAQTAYPITVTENDTYDTTNYNSITVNVSGGGASGTDVIFYDYDDTIVQTYSAADFANLSAMPANPTHEGLTAQGWNWSLADAKTYVATYGKLNIGQMYITSDSKTRLYYIIPKDTLTLNLYLSLDEDTELDVDWGDNSEHTTWTSEDGDSSKSHEYSNGGSYTIAITVVSGGFSYQSFNGNEDYTLKKVEFGSGITNIGDNAFYGCQSLTSITIPNGVTRIGDNAFTNCQSLTSISISNSVTYIGEQVFDTCRALTSITIPNGVTRIGDNAFYGCQALTSISIPNSVTYIGTEAFSYCQALTSISIPNSVTYIGTEAFSYCQALTSISIPNGVINIGEYTFSECYALTSITISNSVENIDYSAFYMCYALTSITFEPTTPPELNGNLPLLTTCIIRVPQGTLSDYTSASYYPDSSQYIYEEY